VRGGPADISKSKVSADALAAFLASEVKEDVTSVPGIGPAAAKKLAEAVEGDQAITTTYQLIGKFLTLKGKGVSQAEHCDAMWFWLQARGLDSHRAGIVHSIAEKVSPWFALARFFLRLVSLVLFADPCGACAQVNIMMPGTYTAAEDS
jgi:hypothetical protein